MNRNASKFVLSGLLLAISFSSLVGQDAFEEGKKFYKQRAADSDSFRANPLHINKAIEAFQESLDHNIAPAKSAAYLLQAYYFKGMFTGISEDQKKEVYEKGRTLGEKMMEKFPNSVPIKFWYGANIGRWADVHGFVKAATSGIAKKLRRICKDIIRIDPEYQGGGGYRILAQVHFYSPSIPILMGWPSDDKALKLIEQALAIEPDHPTNRILYAKILLELDHNEKAEEQLRYILNMKPRPTHLVEDKYVLHRSRQLLQEHYNLSQ